jgi:tetratricopeptide (TPR) repeat protein
VKRSIFLALVLVLFAACAGGQGKTVVDAAKGTQRERSRVDEALLAKGNNGLYYYLASLVSRQMGRDEQADRLLDVALDTDSSSSYLWAHRAFNRAQKNDWDRALADAETGLSKNPNDVDSLVLVGKLYAAKGDPARALEYYRRGLARDRKNEEIYNVMAREYLSLKRTDEAVGALKTCVGELPEAMGCIYYLATILKQVGRDSEAIRYFALMGELNPDNEKILENLGEVYIHQKDLRKALDVYIQLKQMNAGDFAAAIRVALIYFELKETDKAIAEFEALSRAFPSSDRMHYFLGLLYVEKKQLVEASGHLSKVGPESAFYFDSVMRTALMLKEQGKLDEAIIFVERKSAHGKPVPELFDLRASLQSVAGNRKRALELISDGISRFPSDDKLLFQRAVLLDRMDRWDDSKKDLLKLIARSPENATALNYIGYSLVEKGKEMASAREYLEKAHALKPEDSFIADSLGWWHFKNGEVEIALKLISEASRKAKDEPTIQEHLGDIYLSLKNKRMARQNYEEALRILRGSKERGPDDEKQIKSIEDKLAGF